MARTMAEVLMEEGQQKGERRGELRARQQTLLRQMRRRFGELPSETVATVEATHNIEQLDIWLDRFATAETLDDIAIPLGS
jgi:hypothetical protein